MYIYHSACRHEPHARGYIYHSACRHEPHARGPGGAGYGGQARDQGLHDQLTPLRRCRGGHDRRQYIRVCVCVCVCVCLRVRVLCVCVYVWCVS